MTESQEMRVEFRGAHFEETDEQIEEDDEGTAPNRTSVERDATQPQARDQVC